MNTRDRGFALMLVIWALLMLTSMSVGFAYAVRHEARASVDVETLAETEAAFSSGITYSILALNAKEEEQRWKADGRPRRFEVGDLQFEVLPGSESGRIDLNRASRELLVGLFSQFTTQEDPEALADALIDWRDGDDRTGPKGAEHPEYRLAGYAYDPPNRPLVSTNELSQVYGFDRDLVEKLLPHVTTFSRISRLHAQSAGLVELSAIPGISRERAAQFIALRDDAMESGQAPDVRMLRDGRRYLDLRTVHRVLSLDVRVTLANGVKRREQFVLQLDPARGAIILASQPRPMTDTDATTLDQYSDISL